ncbi:MAG: hypothetical protein JST66_15720 [Bacteroidetes bacterium]|nr:hypothetical protein [Bacteroidota bacterium]
MKHSLSSLYAISALLLVAGCSKERGEPTPDIATNVPFSPQQAQIDVLLGQFQHQRAIFRSRSSDDLGERPLNEAVWLSEADANYMKCDPSANEGEATEGTIDLTLPVHQGEGGSLWVNNRDLLTKQEELLSELTEVRQGGTLYLVHIDMQEASSELVALRASWTKITSNEDRGIIEPDPGCWKALVGNVEISPRNDAADVMKSKMRDLHTYPLGTYFVSVSLPQIIGDNTQVWTGLNNYPVYAGTPTTQYDGQGPGWIHSGWNSPTELCFPNYWSRYLTMKQFFAPPSSFEPGREVIWEDWSADYAVLSGGPMDYGSPYYPMGPYHHTWVWKHGIPKRRLSSLPPPE